MACKKFPKSDSSTSRLNMQILAYGRPEFYPQHISIRHAWSTSSRSSEPARTAPEPQVKTTQTESFPPNKLCMTRDVTQ